MELNRTLLLNRKQIEQRIDRIAYQIYEDNATEKEITVVGILSSGFQLAQMIAGALKKIAPFQVNLISLKIDKHSQEAGTIELPVPRKELNDKVIILVDDVLNSGKTMMYALKPFLDVDIRKIRTVVLVDRNHRSYPVNADYVGLSLATTLQDHVSAEFEKDEASVFLS